MSLATAIVDPHALLQLAYVSLAAGVGICVVYAVAVVGITRANEFRKAERPGIAFIHGVLAMIAVAACAWSVIAGISIMTSK